MRNKIILAVLILSIIALIFSGCGGNIVTPPNGDQSSVDRASIHGYIKSIEKDVIKNKLTPISNASVYLTDSDGKDYTVSTDTNGYYEFNGLSAGVNYIITASCIQKNDILIYKDVATKVIEGKDLDAGTADATSTTLALVLEELDKNGISPAEVDAEKVVNCEGFSEVKEEVEKVLLDKKGNITESDAINQSVSSFSSSSFDPITGSTTWGTEILELSPDSYQPKISDLIGYKKKDFRFITLDGTKNSVELNTAALVVEFDLDDGGGGITADLGIFKIILASEGEGERHWIGVEGNILGKAIRIELDFTPGFSAITTSSAYSDYNLIEDTPFVIRLVDYWSDESKILCEGNSSQWIFLPDEGEEEYFLGYWVNEDPNTPSITKIDIQKNNNLLEIYMWGKCHPTDCDWAAMNNPEGPATTTVDDADDGILNIVWYPDFAIKTQEITYLGGDRLEVYTFTDFYPDDIYGREDYERYDYFIKND